MYGYRGVRVYGYRGVGVYGYRGVPLIAWEADAESVFKAIVVLRLRRLLSPIWKHANRILEGAGVAVATVAALTISSSRLRRVSFLRKFLVFCSVILTVLSGVKYAAGPRNSQGMLAGAAMGAAVR